MSGEEGRRALPSHLVIDTSFRSTPSEPRTGSGGSMRIAVSNIHLSTPPIRGRVHKAESMLVLSAKGDLGARTGDGDLQVPMPSPAIPHKGRSPGAPRTSLHKLGGASLATMGGTSAVKQGKGKVVVCRLCEEDVFENILHSHTRFCKVASQADYAAGSVDRKVELVREALENSLSSMEDSSINMREVQATVKLIEVCDKIIDAFSFDYEAVRELGAARTQLATVLREYAIAQDFPVLGEVCSHLEGLITLKIVSVRQTPMAKTMSRLLTAGGSSPSTELSLLTEKKRRGASAADGDFHLSGNSSGAADTPPTHGLRSESKLRASDSPMRAVSLERELHAARSGASVSFSSSGHRAGAGAGASESSGWGSGSGSGAGQDPGSSSGPESRSGACQDVQGSGSGSGQGLGSGSGSGQSAGPGSGSRLGTGPVGDSVPALSVTAPASTAAAGSSGLAENRSGSGGSLGSSPMLVPIGRSVSNASVSSRSGARMRPRSATVHVGVNDFEPIKPISRGAYGRVMLARKKKTGDIYAIKIIPKVDWDRKKQGQAQAEKMVYYSVNSPFIVKIYHTFRTKKNLFFVMDFLCAGDLLQLVMRDGPMPEDVARKYLVEIVLALEHLHAQGIVHRDLKPDNFLIGKKGHLQLTDFGLSLTGLNAIQEELKVTGMNLSPGPAGAQSRARKASGINRTDMVVGTPDYLSPEVLTLAGHGEPVDWWALGVIAFELLTGIPPFNDDSPEEIFSHILKREMWWPEVPEEMSFEAHDLIDRLLCLDPAKRLGTDGVDEIKSHPFFKGVDWSLDAVLATPMPFVPKMASEEDTIYFDPRKANFSNVLESESEDEPRDDLDDDPEPDLGEDPSFDDGRERVRSGASEHGEPDPGRNGPSMQLRAAAGSSSRRGSIIAASAAAASMLAIPDIGLEIQAGVSEGGDSEMDSDRGSVRRGAGPPGGLFANLKHGRAPRSRTSSIRRGDDSASERSPSRQRRDTGDSSGGEQVPEMVGHTPRNRSRLSDKRSWSHNNTVGNAGGSTAATGITLRDLGHVLEEAEQEDDFDKSHIENLAARNFAVRSSQADAPSRDSLVEWSRSVEWAIRGTTSSHAPSGTAPRGVASATPSVGGPSYASAPGTRVTASSAGPASGSGGASMRDASVSPQGTARNTGNGGTGESVPPSRQSSGTPEPSPQRIIRINEPASILSPSEVRAAVGGGSAPAAAVGAAGSATGSTSQRGYDSPRPPRTNSRAQTESPSLHLIRSTDSPILRPTQSQPSFVHILRQIGNGDSENENEVFPSDYDTLNISD